MADSMTGPSDVSEQSYALLQSSTMYSMETFRDSSIGQETILRSVTTLTSVQAKKSEERSALKTRCFDFTRQIDITVIRDKSSLELQRMRGDLINEKQDLEEVLKREIAILSNKLLREGGTVAELEESLKNKKRAALMALVLLIFIVTIFVTISESFSWTSAGIGGGVILTSGVAGRKIFQMATASDVWRVGNEYEGLVDHLRELRAKWQEFENTVIESLEES